MFGVIRKELTFLTASLVNISQVNCVLGIHKEEEIDKGDGEPVKVVFDNCGAPEKGM